MACKKAISLRYMLRCQAARLRGWTNLYDDNNGIPQSSTLIDSESKERHLAIAYHKIWEHGASGIINPIKIHTDYNISDFLTKATEWGTHHYDTGESLVDGRLGHRLILP